VAAGDLLDVQPDVRFGRQLCRQLVVLPVAAANKNRETVRRHEPHGAARRQLHALFAVRLAQIAAGDKLRPDLL